MWLSESYTGSSRSECSYVVNCNRLRNELSVSAINRSYKSRCVVRLCGKMCDHLHRRDPREFVWRWFRKKSNLSICFLFIFVFANSEHTIYVDNFQANFVTCFSRRHWTKCGNNLFYFGSFRRRWRYHEQFRRNDNNYNSTTKKRVMA